MRQQRGRQASSRPRRRAAYHAADRLRRHAAYRAADRLRRRVAREVSGRIRLGTAGASPWLRRWVLAAVLLGVALLPYPALGSGSGTPAAACRPGCRSGPVPNMIRWTRPLSGAWQVLPGLTGTAPASGLAYVSIGYGAAVIGTGLTVTAYSSATGAPLWEETLTGFPAGAAIVSVRTWPGEVTAGVSYGSAGHLRRTEVVISGVTGIQSGRYPAAVFGGAVGASPQYTVIVGPTAVTSYDNATGRVRWTRPTGPLPQAWRTDGGTLYVAESAGGFLASAPVTALLQINLSTGAESLAGPLEGLSFDGTLSAAFDGVVLFSSAGGVTAYQGATGARLWSIGGAVPEGTDPRKQRIYLTKDSNLIAVNPLTGQETATVSGSAADGSAGMYVVRDGVALGLDQDANGDAWGYSISAQRVTLAAAALPWPHYFVDPSGVGGSADPAGDLVVIAACAQLGRGPAISPSPSATASGTSVPAQTPTASASPAVSTPAVSTPAVPTPAVSRPAGSAPAVSTPAGSAPASGTPGPDASPSASPSPGQACARPELVALSL